MSGLRQRTTSTDKQSVQLPAKSAERLNSFKLPPSRSSGRLYLLFTALIASGLLYLSTRTSFFFSSLQSSYALCSPDGNHIYTVNEHNLRTQCIVVQKAHIADYGSLGKSFFFTISFQALY